jgi:predicted TIM-barrel fold metal-dependent hydrolase
MIDTHVHHWELGRFQYPWLADAAFDDLRKDYSPADYRADAAELPVDGWVHIQAEVDHQLDPVAETAGWSRLPKKAAAARTRLTADGEWPLKSSTDLLS